MSDTRTTLQRVNLTLDAIEKMLAEMVGNQSKEINAETDRQSYKEGLVDGLCMMSWVGEVNGNAVDFVGECKDGEAKLLSDVLEEIGSVYGFDGKAELLRVKSTDEDGLVKPELKEVTDEDVDANEPMGEDEMI